MDSSQTTPLVLTFNEASNIERSLRSLTWAKEIVVLDSGSTDGTMEIALRFRMCRSINAAFDTHRDQWNYGLSLLQTEWALTLDADYVLPATFIEELRQLDTPTNTNAFFAHFTYCIFGRPLRGSLYPPRAVLFRKEKARYVQDGHTQQLRFEGSAGELKTRILHDDRKPLSHWLAAQEKYATLEARKLRDTPDASLSFQDRLRKWILPVPLLMPFYCLIVRGLLFDGAPGGTMHFKGPMAEAILALKLIEEKLAVPR